MELAKKISQEKICLKFKLGEIDWMRAKSREFITMNVGVFNLESQRWLEIEATPLILDYSIGQTSGSPLKAATKADKKNHSSLASLAYSSLPVY